MIHVPERSVGVAIMAVAALGLLAGAWLQPWFEYDWTSSRQTPPDGPYNEGDDGILRADLTFYADRWEGTTEPADPALADAYAIWVPVGMFAAAGLLAIVALGEIPFIHRLIRRRVALGLLSAALLLIVATAALAWVWLPDTMAGHQVDSQYAASLDDDSGYTESNLATGWYLLAFVPGAVIAALLLKFQAGAADFEVVKARLAEAP